VSAVYKSNDAGKTFMQLPPSPSGTGAGNINITSVDTTFYWKIRASNASSYSAWSNTGVFITEPELLGKTSAETNTIMTTTTSPEINQPSATTFPSQPPAGTTTTSPTASAPIEQVPSELVRWLFYLCGAMLVKMNRYD
jgi:hypothetical protein